MKTKEKMLNIKISPDMYKQLKLQSVIQERSLRDIVETIIADYLVSIQDNAPLILEPLDEQDRNDLEEGKDDIVNGDYQDMDEVFKELDRESNNN
jgi:hypothetical protein